MKALVYTAPERVEYRDEITPKLEHGESLVKIDAVGICGSDLHAYLGHDARRVPPLILGHEVCGTVIDGELTSSRVVINPLITCGVCDVCLDGRTNLCQDRKLIGMNRPGAFAEYVTIPTRNLVEVPSDSSEAHLALTEPAATALHAIRLANNVVARPLSEGRALVIGGGSIGILAAYFLKDYGCKDIVLSETNMLRRKTASSTGVCKAIDGSAESTEGLNFDVVIDAVGSSKTREISIASVAPGGVVVHVGLGDAVGGLNARTMTLSEITFIGTYTYTGVDLKVAARKIYASDIGPLNWIDERRLADGASAFQELIEGKVSSPKIVLRP